MRKPHQHEQDGQRFDCIDPNCRMPFKVQLQRKARLRTYNREKHASREEQHARYLDCGPLAWDDRD